jgi:metal-sulfur cluster biosynthetic enzyme
MTGTDPTAVSEDEVRDALRTVIDPEVGVDIVALGLVYDVELSGGETVVRMTMTTPTCPMGEYLRESAAAAIADRLPNAPPARVDLVFDPPWTPAMMSGAARERFGWPGG